MSRMSSINRSYRHLEDEPRTNFMGCLVDPLWDKAEIELRDTNMVKKNKNNENPLEKTAIVAGSRQEHSSSHRNGDHPTIFGLSRTQISRRETNTYSEHVR